MIDDLGEVAQLATEFISTLDNLPQEVQHIIKEIEHKDAKIQGKSFTPFRLRTLH
jgi:chromatin modification-related protein YNG2